MRVPCGPSILACPGVPSPLLGWTIVRLTSGCVSIAAGTVVELGRPPTISGPVTLGAAVLRVKATPYLQMNHRTALETQ